MAVAKYQTPPTKTSAVAGDRLQFRWVAREDETNVLADLLPDPNDRLGRAKLRVLKEVVLDDSVVAQAGWQSDQNGMKQIVLQSTKSGRQRFAELTSTNVGRRLALVQHGQVIIAPVIVSAIDTATLNLSGRWSLGETARILAVLNRKASTSQSFQFGKSQEDALSPLVGPDYVFLNLRNRLWITNRNGNLGSRETRDWIRRSGADVAAAAEDQMPIAICYDMVAVPAETNTWETTTPTEVKFHWALMTAESEKETPVGKIVGTPDTCYFRTRDEAWGILQVLGFADHPRGVKIRYKLVQNGGREN